MATECEACRIISGEQAVPGGKILVTDYWLVDHCFGPLGVGTLIVKPLRHCVHVAELRPEETRELGPLLQRVANAVQTLAESDQVYVCLWSHAGWRAGHIHFVVQPSWDRYREEYAGPGPGVQMAMFTAGVTPPRDAVEAFSERARKFLEAPAVE